MPNKNSLKTRGEDNRGSTAEILVSGLACSPFEAEAVLGAVHEVYAPFFHGPDAAPRPGQITLVALADDEPAGKPVADCQKRTVTLTLHRCTAAERLLDELGPRDFRRQRIPELCQQALSQGALLTREDIEAILNREKANERLPWPCL